MIERRAAWPRLSVVVGSLLAAACGGGPSQVSFVSNERPGGYNGGYNAQGAPSPAAAHQENPNGGNEPEEEPFEPERPLADSKQERALVHIHGPKNIVCSGVVVDAKIVATAQRCLRGQGKGVIELGAGKEYRVEVASSTLTWTNRKAKYAIVPECEPGDVDLALLVLEEAAPALAAPLKIISAPNTGAHVDALGFGRCAGSSTQVKERTGSVRSRESQSLSIDIPLCRGDWGGPVIDGRDGNVIGVISRRDSPRDSPLKTTKVARLDTLVARDLIAQARDASEGKPAAQAVACK